MQSKPVCNTCLAGAIDVAGLDRQPTKIERPRGLQSLPFAVNFARRFDCKFALVLGVRTRISPEIVVSIYQMASNERLAFPMPALVHLELQFPLVRGCPIGRVPTVSDSFNLLASIPTALPGQGRSLRPPPFDEVSLAYRLGEGRRDYL